MSFLDLPFYVPHNHIYQTYWDTFSPYHTILKYNRFTLQHVVSKPDERVANSVDYDQTLRSLASLIRVYTFCSGLSVPILRLELFQYLG